MAGGFLKSQQLKTYSNLSLQKTDNVVVDLRIPTLIPQKRLCACPGSIMEIHCQVNI